MIKRDGLSVPALREAFLADGYICGDEIIVPVFVSLALGKPLLVEGQPGVGKTEIAKVLSRVFGAPLIRLQCYEGLDENKALYEWNYQKQLLHIQVWGAHLQAAGREPAAVNTPTALEEEIFSEPFLLDRPLLKALRAPEPSVLLIDEIDRTDDEFEAFLFEILSEFQVTIPELGTVTARHVPMVVLTSNRSRELSDALKRRCLLLYIDFPTVDRELEILRIKVPGAGEDLASQVVLAVQHLRRSERIRKKPSIAESIDWARTLVALNLRRLDPDAVTHTLSAILKHKDDLELLSDPAGVGDLVQASRGEPLPE
jgi:MoxR-like ATPase